MKISRSLLALFLFISNYFALVSSKSFFNLTTDQQALFAFKNSIINPNPILLNNWTLHTPPCRWTGVTCGPKNQRVTSLNLYSFELQGTLSPYLGNLTFLRSLNIRANNFTGFLPFELSKLRRLEEIDVGANKFTGEIPPWIGALSKLRRLYLNDNGFSGGIPPSLFNISRLQIMNVGYNNLDGNIPNEIGNLSSMESVILEGNGFNGSVPESLFAISSLKVINLGYNELSGNLPNNICKNIDELQVFTVYYNKFEGEILPSICSCRELQMLQLQVNNFEGNIPVEIGGLSKIEYMYLWHNHFSGDIPNEIGNLTSLLVVILETNNITGNIPKHVGNLTNLKALRFGRNKLTGEVPQELANLATVEVFSVGDNFLSGSFPEYVFNISTIAILDLLYIEFWGSHLPHHQGISLPNLEELYLSRNNLSGHIPSYITNASSLTLLQMTENEFDGFMPNFGNLRNLKTLRIWDNHLRGAKSPTQELEFLSSLTNCRNLEELVVDGNPLNGIFPNSVGNLSTSLVYFYAGDANITGVIPPEVGNLNLRLLNLSRNQLTGFIPSTMGKLRGLQVLFLDRNQLQGSIPDDLCELNNLGDLFLDENFLTGPIPECFGRMKALRNIGLSSNKLNSSLPSTLWNLGDLITLNMSSNDFSGQLSSRISQLKVVTKIDLSSNQFSGEIPTTLDGCESLDILNFSNNKFVGSIPPSLGNTRGLTIIDLSHNSLFGSIPKSLEKLPFLKYFNVSYNNLEGEIPNGGQFLNFTAQSFAQNHGLCGASRFQVPPCAKNHGRSRSERVSLLKRYILPVLISVVIFVLVIIILIRRCKPTKLPEPTDRISLDTAWRVISYLEIEQATKSFSERELLGKGSFGSVFKGTLFDGTNIAVKVFNIQSDRANKSFTMESRILSSIRHRNLVKIISSCTNMEFKALILEFMPNGSLEKWLYSDHHCTDLLRLLNIALDVSLAIEYLHHGHTFPVVHCDIKPSNVLLDEDMTARVADFGIAKLFDEGENMIKTKTLATIGYAAPEYGSEGKVSTCTDVYSYGIMLLEMFTRKKPTDDMFNEEMSLKDWVSAAIKGNSIHEIMAPGLVSEDDQNFVAKEECVVAVFDLAMKCVATLPDERINMIEVAAALQNIKAKIVARVTK